MSVLICPVCRENLEKVNNSLKCKNNHCFDYSKEGYVNLLRTSKNGDKIGDSKDSARARHSFLAKDYYKCLRDFLCARMNGRVVDICCGEGYYDEYNGELYGFDISKEMIRLASKSRKEHTYFVASLVDIPVCDCAFDTALHLFAPFDEKEFSRILKPNGTLYSVIPGEEHLIEMKNIVYDEPYKNDEKAPSTSLLNLVNRHRVKRKVKISGEDLFELFSMTPYFYHTNSNDAARLKSVDEIELTVDFIILEYRKAEVK